jgi:hypothetical protein
MRRRYRYVNGVLTEIPWNSRASAAAPFVWDDLPAYESPIDGKPVDGRRQRRNDLARSGCRPYEGREQEVKEANKVKAEQDRQLDRLADKMAHEAWAQAPERVRKHFRYK